MLVGWLFEPAAAPGRKARFQFGSFLTLELSVAVYVFLRVCTPTMLHVCYNPDKWRRSHVRQHVGAAQPQKERIGLHGRNYLNRHGLR
eukprot:5048642-Amphidinium_carterae.2